ncbi:hypothetical protein [Maritalea porphyrae]|uniref:Uncharacterized protein n=1 Tax=Maritalea porphyrae TaxID=880732 RepID=A0ABQ5UQ41_9HYPH|nr:hypothetical protein [Maritalea porphyrae]GLQ16430.1 hypothetical protein GCM10007879_06790 [Maritalea porphyrae]
MTLIVGLVLLLLAVVLCLTGSPIWWYSFYLAAIYIFAKGDQNAWLPKYRLGGVLRFYLVTVVTGVIVESTRVSLDLWDYHPLLNGVWGVLAFVLFGYFFMMLAMASAYAVARNAVKHRIFAAVLVLGVLVVPAEIANRYVPVWYEPTNDWVLLLFVVGYILEMLIAIFAFNRFLVGGSRV